MDKSDNSQAVTRREFFRTAGRLAAGAGLAAAGAALAMKGSLGQSGGGLANQRCGGGGVCPTCGDVATCGLPAAISLRQVRGEQTRKGT